MTFAAALFRQKGVLADEGLGLKSRSAVLMEAESGRILFELNADEPMAMASTTKIMTCIYAIERGNLDDVVTVSKNAQSQPRVKMGLSEGEKLKLKDLLYALMLESSNDAAVAIAEHISGSEQAFCREITEKAAEIGAENTVFETPNGLDLGDHHSTAHDMAVIAVYALKNSTFRDIIKTPAASFSSDRRSYSFTNKDRLLSEYKGAIGVKTGYTGKAGHCFVGAAERDGMTLISTVLASGWGSSGKAAKWSDTKKLLDYGFDNYKMKEIFSGEDFAGEFDVQNADKPKGRAVFFEGLRLPLKEGETPDIKLEFSDNIQASVRPRDKVGEAVVFLDGSEVGRVGLVSDEFIERHTFDYIFFKIVGRWIDMAV